MALLMKGEGGEIIIDGMINAANCDEERGRYNQAMIKSMQQKAKDRPNKIDAVPLR